MSMPNRQATVPVLLAVLASIGVVSPPGIQQCRAAETPAATTTWAEGHPEVLELFGRPFSPEG
ncbi:MAG: hypothetical protein VX304_06830, partial [Planctomycetota bacterium]|nr:hypothetical protein [Planctomycetota bacterium]